MMPGGDFSSGHTKKPLEALPKAQQPLSTPAQPSPASTEPWGGLAPLRSLLPGGSPSFACRANAVGMGRASGMGLTWKNQVELVKLQALRAGGWLEMLLNTRRGWKLPPPPETIVRGGQSVCRRDQT